MADFELTPDAINEEASSQTAQAQEALKETAAQAATIGMEPAFDLEEKKAEEEATGVDPDDKKPVDLDVDND